ncbi:MAG TPA: SRPBCC domain-containing protein [Chitinophagaceae bacterium]|nr:SRPBCC domain-containing protein [Chitinophagaceae bacterium]
MQYIVEKSIRIQATPSEVWDALTNPDKTKKYFFNCRVFSDWIKGSPITFKGKIFLVKKIEMKGTILQAEPEKLLQYTLGNAGDGNGSISTVTDRLRFENGETVLSISDNVGQGEDVVKRYLRSEKGWDKVLKKLKALLEKI